MTTRAGMSSDRVESYREWQLEILPLSKEGVAEKAWIYPAEYLATMESDEQRVIHAESLPFDVVINGYSPNGCKTTPRRKTPISFQPMNSKPVT